MHETLKELTAELAVLHESLERAEVIERQLPKYLWEIEADLDAATDRAEAAEKDSAACRAEYRDLFAKSGAMSDKLIAAESTVAGLRRALADIQRNDLGRTIAHSIATTALAATPAEHERRIKSEALREMARLFMATAKSDLSYHNRDLAARFCNAAASELEATNGR